MPHTFKPGDRVMVLDPALAQLRAIMAKYGEPPLPNHHGTVDRVEPEERGVREEAAVLINFDDGGCAPYPASEVRHLEEGRADG